MEEQLPPPPPKWVTKTSFDTPLDMSFAAVMERKSTQITQLLTNHIENVTNEQYWPELTRVITRLRRCLEIVQSPTSLEIYGEEAILAAMENCVNITIKLKSIFLKSLGGYVTTLGYPLHLQRSFKDYLNPSKSEAVDDFDADDNSRGNPTSDRRFGRDEPERFGFGAPRDTREGRFVDMNKTSTGNYSTFKEEEYILNMSLINNDIIDIMNQFGEFLEKSEGRAEDFEVRTILITFAKSVL